MNACPELNELLAVKDRPADDPGRVHLESCPRCRNRVMLYADFENPASAPPEMDLVDAERRLSASLAALRGRVPVPDPARVSPRTSERERPAFLDTVFGWLSGPRPLRLAVAAALIAAVAVVLIRPSQFGVRPDSAPVPTLRAGGGPTLQLETPEALPDGRVRLAWSADPQAEHYRVRVLGPDLTELLSRDVVGETELAIDRSMLSARIEPGTVLGWNVAVFRGGGEIQRSTTATLRAP